MSQRNNVMHQTMVYCIFTQCHVNARACVCVCLNNSEDRYQQFPEKGYLINLIFHKFSLNCREYSLLERKLFVERKLMMVYKYF